MELVRNTISRLVESCPSCISSTTMNLNARLLFTVINSEEDLNNNFDVVRFQKKRYYCPVVSRWRSLPCTWHGIQIAHLLKRERIRKILWNQPQDSVESTTFMKGRLYRL